MNKEEVNIELIETLLKSREYQELSAAERETVSEVCTNEAAYTKLRSFLLLLPASHDTSHDQVELADLQKRLNQHKRLQSPPLLARTYWIAAAATLVLITSLWFLLKTDGGSPSRQAEEILSPPLKSPETPQEIKEHPSNLADRTTIENPTRTNRVPANDTTVFVPPPQTLIPSAPLSVSLKEEEEMLAVLVTAL